MDAEAAGPLTGKRVVLGVSGGIAAYKAVEVCRRLVADGAQVVPVLTAHATRFVGELTFSALASERARRSLWDDETAIPHTRLGQSADLVLVVPATAHLIGRYAAGLADDLLTATLLATRAPVVVCPAMHSEMWEHPAVRDGVATLRRRGVMVVEPGTGLLAGGDTGVGRLAEPDKVVEAARKALSAGGLPPRDMEGVSVLVTAGGTREPIDPVRFVGNRSSGKQGYAIAEAAAARGARVTLVATVGRSVAPLVEVVRVETAEEMAEAVLVRSSSVDVVVMAAAVADFRPKAPSPAKLRKLDGVPEVVLEPTPDILAELGARRPPRQVIVGFSAETRDVEGSAAAKRERKGADIFVANDVGAPGVGFDHDTNAVTLIGDAGGRVRIGLTDKATVAAAVLDEVVALLDRRRC